MRILFLFFLLVNAAYFYLQQKDADAPSMSAIIKQPPMPKGVETLTLLRERGLGLKTATREAEPSPVPEPMPPPKPRPKPELKTPPEKIVAKAPEAQSVTPKKAAREPACFTLGPFTKANIASRTAKAISELGVEVGRREESKRTPKGYWVYLPPANSYQAAKRMVAELQKKGVKDLFIMGKGSRANAISLGLFKNEGAAEDRFNRVKKMGLDVKLETQYRVSQQAWLDITVPGGEATTVAKIIELSEGLQQTELGQRKCQ